MHDSAGRTKDKSTSEMESTIENQSISDLGIIVMLMVAVTFVISYNFFFTVGWIWFIKSSIHIVPTVISLMLQSRFYFKRTVLKITTAISLIMIMALKTIFALLASFTFMNLNNFTTKRTNSTSIAAINYVVKKPYITIYMLYVLASINCILMFNLSHSFKTIEAVSLSLMILTAPFNHINFSRGLICLVTSFIGISEMLFGTSIFNLYHNAVIIMPFLFVLLNFCFSLINDIRSHEIIYIAIALCFTTFTHDLVLSFVEIPDFVAQFLSSYLHMEVLLIYILIYQFIYQKRTT